MERVASSRAVVMLAHSFLTLETLRNKKTLLYALFLFSYNSPKWVSEMFPRFVIPLVSFLLLTLEDRLPKDKRILSSLALLNIAISVLLKTAVHVMPPY